MNSNQRTQINNNTDFIPATAWRATFLKVWFGLRIFLRELTGLAVTSHPHSQFNTDNNLEVVSRICERPRTNWGFTAMDCISKVKTDGWSVFDVMWDQRTDFRQNLIFRCAYLPQWTFQNFYLGWSWCPNISGRHFRCSVLGCFYFYFLGTTPSQSSLLQMHLMHGIWKITKRERESDTAIYPALFLKLIINVINKKVCV